MKIKNKNNNKILKFSIRKLSLGAAPVVISALIFGSYMPSEVLANENTIVNYTYLAENELTDAEKSLIKKNIPSDVKENEIYYMVYKKDPKPTSEIKTLPNTGQNSLPLTGLAVGAAVLVVLLVSKKYRNKVLSVVLIGAMGQSVIMPFESFAFENKELVSYNTQKTIANSNELANGVIKIDGYSYVGYFTQSDLKTLPNQVNPTVPEKSTNPTNPNNPTPQPNPQPQPEYKTTPDEGPKVPIVEKPELKVTKEVVPFETIKQNDNTLPKGQAKVIKEGVNGERTVLTEVTTIDGVQTSKVIDNSITTQPVNKIVAVGTKEVTPAPEHKTTPDEGPKVPIVEKPELKVTKEVIPFETIEQNDDTLPKGQTKVIRDGVNGERTILTEVSTVDGVQISKVVDNSITTQPVNKIVAVGTKEAAPAVDKTALQNAIATANSKNKDDYTTQSWADLTTALATANTINNDNNTTQNAVNEATQNLLKAIEKLVKLADKPVLKLVNTNKNELEHSATAKYTLENPTNAEVKSITATLKKGNEIVKTVDLTKDNLDAVLSDLDFYKEYTLSTTIVYNQGNGEKSETLTDEKILLEPKKIEVKDIKRTDLIKYENKVETDATRLTSVPQDLTNYYLKVTSNDHKTTLLAVKNIEEADVDGKKVYKVTAVADNLVQRNASNNLSDVYTYYIEKPKAKEDNVYYDFAELINAMQVNPAGEFLLGQSMSAKNVVPTGKSYVATEFTGKLLSNGDKRYAIHDLEHPLFNNINNAIIKNINFENVAIDRSGEDNISAIGNNLKNNATIENVKITGSITGKNNVAGVVNNIHEDGKVENVAFIGKINSVGNDSTVGGIAGSNYMGFVNRAYVDATITANNAHASMLVPFVNYKAHSWLSGTKGKLTNSVAKGILDVKNTKYVGGIVAKTWPYGAVQNNVTYAKVIKGEELFGSNDVNDGDANPFVSNLFGVIGYSSSEDGTGRDNKNKNKLKHLSKAEADEKVASFNITADTLTSEAYDMNTINNITPSDKAYTDIQDYNTDYSLAYKNLEKLQPFYNKDYIVNQANKLAKDHNLNTKEVLSVTPMNNNDFITNLSAANKIVVHYADGTKDHFSLSESNDGLTNVKEYEITDLGIKYTPNIVQKDHSNLINGIKAILSPIELQSDPIYKHLNRTGNNRVNAIKDLYLEESFDYVKKNLDVFVEKLVQNEDHQLNNSVAAQQMILDKVEKNKAALLLGLTYLNRYYGVKFGDVNIKELMLFKPDFYGKNVDVLDRLIEMGSKESYISGGRTFDAFGEVLAKSTKSGNLEAFLNYNRSLFTNFTDMNDWFIDATKDKVYIAERASEVDAIKDAKYRAFDNLKRAHLRKTLLPLLNIEKSHIYLISNYNSIAFGSAERLGKKSFADIKDTVDKAADGYRNYYDFWYRLAADNVKNRLLRDSVIPLWEGYNAPGGWVDKHGRYGQQNEYTPLRELFGPIGKYFGNNGAGAYAVIYDNPNDTRTEVNYIYLNMIDEYGISVYTHETTHVNDGHIYLGGFGRREGTSFEAFAQGMLQTPVAGSGFDEFGSLGINMVFKRPNDGNQWYITDPKTLKTREDIDRYMRGYNDALTLLDEIEAEAVISQQNKDLNGAWFKKMDKEYRDNNHLNHWDKIRHLSKEEKDSLNIQSVNDLVDQQLMTNRNPGNGIYKPEVVSYHDQSPYVGVRMMTGIYGGNTSDGAPGAVSFKHNAFRLWGYYGYENGFLGYASNKLKQASKADGNTVLSDKYIINKISGGRFSTLEEFKKAYFQEVKDKAKVGLTTFEVNGTSVSSYDELLALFKDAVTKDAQTLKADNNGNKSVSMNHTLKLKEEVYKKLLQRTDSFKTSIFK